MMTSVTSDFSIRSWDMQLEASVGNLHIADHYITGIHTVAIHYTSCQYAILSRA